MEYITINSAFRIPPNMSISGLILYMVVVGISGKQTHKKTHIWKIL